MTNKENAGRERLAYKSAMAAVKKAIRGKLMAAPLYIRPMTRHLAGADGKNIRASAVLICSMDAEGTVPEGAVNAAAAVELLHLATLVHDDIIDDAATRRGIATLNRIYDEKTAVLCGDYLLCLALELVADITPREERRSLADKSAVKYLTDICLGELRQNRNRHNYGMAESEYMKIISGKTAALFEFSFFVGYLLSDEPAERKADYLELGRSVGLMFQMADDVSNYTSTRELAKKPVLSDYAQGVITLPLIYALESDVSLRARVEAGLDEKVLRQAVEEAGGIAYTEKKIAAKLRRARKIAADIGAGAVKTEHLMAVIDRSAGM